MPEFTPQELAETIDRVVAPWKARAIEAEQRVSNLEAVIQSQTEQLAQLADRVAALRRVAEHAAEVRSFEVGDLRDEAQEALEE